MTPYTKVEHSADGIRIYLVDDKSRIVATVEDATPEVIKLLEAVPELVTTVKEIAEEGVCTPCNVHCDPVCLCMEAKQALEKAGIS